MLLSLIHSIVFDSSSPSSVTWITFAKLYPNLWSAGVITNFDVLYTLSKSGRLLASLAGVGLVKFVNPLPLLFSWFPVK